MALLGELPVRLVELGQQDTLLLPQELLQLLEGVPQPLPLRGHLLLQGTRVEAPEPSRPPATSVRAWGVGAVERGARIMGKRRGFGEEKLEEWRGVAHLDVDGPKMTAESE